MEIDQRENKIREVLDGVYCGVKHGGVNGLAAQLNRIVRSDIPLSEIFTAVYEWEDDEDIKATQAHYVYALMLDFLSADAPTARRLLKVFLTEYDDFQTFYKLYTEYADYLTSEELKAVRRKAWSLFDKELMRGCGFDWENEV